MRAKSTESCSGVSPKRRSSCTSVGFLMGIRFRIRIFSGRISCVRARASLMVTIPSFFNSVMASRPSAILIGKVKTSLGRQLSKGFWGMGSGRAWTKGLWGNKKLSPQRDERSCYHPISQLRRRRCLLRYDVSMIPKLCNGSARAASSFSIPGSEAIFHGLTARPFTMWALSLPVCDHVLFSSLPV